MKPEPLNPADIQASLNQRLESIITDLTGGMPIESVPLLAMAVRASFLAGMATRDEISQAASREFVGRHMQNPGAWIKRDLERAAKAAEAAALAQPNIRQ